MKNLKKIVCTWCGSEKVEIKTWINANTLIVAEDSVVEDCLKDGWCNICQEHKELEILTVIPNGKKT